MKQVRLGRTELLSGKNAFGALPVQRVPLEQAVFLLRRAYDAGFTFFDTARAYSDSEAKMGEALSGLRSRIVIATKTGAKTGAQLEQELDTSLKMLKTDYVDIYQFHNPGFCPKPGDGTGLYEAAEAAKKQGKIRFIGITNHSMEVAREAVESGLYDTLQFPFSYLSNEEEIQLVELCKERDVGFIAMKALAGGLIVQSDAAYAWLDQYDNVLPIWGIQREKELDTFIGYMQYAPVLNAELREIIKLDRTELAEEFCRGCGYCMQVCPAEIQINLCARMIQMIRRSPSENWLSESGQAAMKKIENCGNCGQCISKCPYHLNVPKLLKKHYDDYRSILSGAVSVA